MKQLLLAPFFILMIMQTACAQNGNGTKQPKIGGECEGCEAVHESSVPFDKLPWTDTLQGFNENGPRLVISGIIYQPDGKTPAKDVVLYFYHTNQQGVYPTKGNETGWGRRHGYLRGWVKTNEKGQYRFYTIRPGSYPNSNAPQHIHPTIKEPGKNEYWIDEFVFDDDPNLTAAERANRRQRGGDGLIKLVKKDGMLVGERNIILGKNVPNYR